MSIKFFIATLTKSSLSLFLLLFLFIANGTKVEAASANWSYSIATGYYTNCSATVYASTQTCTHYIPNGDNGDICTAWAPISMVSPYDIWVTSTTGSGDSIYTTYNQCQSSSQIYATEGTFSASTDKDSYAPGETIGLTLGEAHDGAPGNCSDFGLFGCQGTHGMRITATLGAQSATNNQSANWTVSRTLTAPSTPGTYTIGLDGGWYDTSNFTAGSSMSITVAAASCGWYSGTDGARPTGNCTFNLTPGGSAHTPTPSGSNYTTTELVSPTPTGYTGSDTWSCSNGTWSPGDWTCTPPPPTVNLYFSFLDKIESFVSNIFINTVFASGK